MNEISKKDCLMQFWSLYETEGSLQAMSWLDTLKYYEEYGQNDITCLCKQLSEHKL